MDFVNTLTGILTLITGLCGLIGTGIATYFAVRNWITALKEKNANEIWTMIIGVADAAMKEAEASGKSGADKKQMVIDIVKASCKAAGLDIDLFADQLSDYIDQSIKFVNDMNKKG